MKYRSDIDGLRAVAVLAVVSFHLSLPWLADGGYVGVDIFFVISGFLITGIIFEAFSSGAYSIIDFYRRRIRRIFPALFVVYLFVILASFLVLFPNETESIGKSIFSSVFFVSNIFFSQSTNYFDTATKINPVLHTWSLSVEEQFYVLFPLFLFAISSFSLQTKKIIILALLVCLFILSVWWLHVSPINAFYLVQFRAWELLLGSALAIGIFPQTKNRVWSEIIGIAGLTAIFISVFYYDEATPFPGLTAALPCCGAAAIIYAGGCYQGFVSRILGFEPIRRIGQISYSMYLWHWPLIVFYSYLFPYRGIVKLGLLALIFLVSFVSWRFIEQPFRQPSSKLTQSKTFSLALAAMAFISIVSYNLAALGNMLNSTPPLAQHLIEALNYDSSKPNRLGACFLTNTNTYVDFKKDPCLNISNDKRNVLIIGDSHAAHLYPGYMQAFPDINFLQATASGCKPTLNSKGALRCLDLLNYIQNSFLPAHHLDTIIMSSQWKKSDILPAVALAEHLRKYADHVVISGPIVEYRQALPRVVARATVANVNADQFASDYLFSDQKETDKEFSVTKLPDGVIYVSPYSALCKPLCRTMVDDQTPMQFDYGHLTSKGSVYVAQQIGAKALGLNSP
jgi:peptidoglycan/LPS O-acetylase OafA/YrhL